MAINYGANYIGVDKDRYDAGNQFYSQDRFLQGIGLDKPAITFNPSRSNTGIMSAYPKPIIPLYDSGGDGPVNPRGPSYGYKSQFDPVTQNKEYLDDIGEGTIDDEDMPKGPGLSLMDMVRAGGAYMLGGPLNMMSSLNKSNKRNELNAYASDEEIDEINKKINKQYGTISDESGSTDYGGTGYEGMTDAQSDKERSEGGRGKRADGGRIGYKDGYSVQDDMTDYATNVGREASPDGGFKDSGGNNNSVDNINIPTDTSNLDFRMEKEVNPAFSYANNFGKFGGLLDLTRTIQEEEPVGNIGYLDPSGNFTIGYNTDLGTVGNANLGNFNLGYTGVGGPTVNYMGGFAGDAGRLGVNYNRDTGLNLGVSYNKKFNSGGIVGLYR